MRFRALRALLPIGILVLLAPAAQASTLVGSATGTADTNMTACFLSPYCTSFTAGGAPSPVVGSDGVIVTWRINAGSAPIDAQTRLRVVRPLGGGTFTGAGTSAVVTPATIGINAYPTRLKVQAGDIIGVDNDDQALYFDSSGAAFTATYFNSPGLADGATQAPSGTNPPAKRLLLEADLEPDIDGDGFGDETQDACPRASTDQTLPCDPDDIGVAAGGGAAMPPGIPPGPGGVLAAPVTGKSVNVDTVSGTVLVKVPGSKAFVVLGKQERQIPTGSIIDTRKGRVTIVTGVGTGSKATQSAVFYDGVFKFTQPRAKRDAIAEATLVGKLENCPKRKARGGAFDAGKRRGRRLWGSGKGRFRTRGRRSSTTVRGTVWLVEDRCDGTTLNRVTRGKVVVRDFGRRRNINLKAPGTYVARP